MNFKWISSLILLLRVYFCICFTSMYQIDGQTAKARFCSQKYFDSLSFDGQSYKFTVNRRVIRFVSDSPRYTFEVFKLKYNPQTDTFWYSSSTIDYDNSEYSVNTIHCIYTNAKMYISNLSLIFKWSSLEEYTLTS